MAYDGTVLITDAGHKRLNEAVRTETRVTVAHVAMGDGNGANYAPGYGQEALKNERARVPIKNRVFLGDNVWLVRAEFAANDTAPFVVREIGFIDAEGALLFLWAGTDVSLRQAGAVDYLLDHALDLGRVANGLVVVQAPDDAVFCNAVLGLHRHAITAEEQFKQRLILRDLQSAA